MLTRAVGSFLAQSRWFAARCALALLAATGLYAAAAFILGLIAVNRNFRASDPAVAIYVRGNGVHTDIVLPFANSFHDWKEEFQPVDPTASVAFISFSWGDRGF